MFFFYPLGGSGDPLGGGDAGLGAPEGEEGEVSEVGFDLFAHAHGMGVDVEGFASVGGIHGTRGDAVVDRRIHVVPPEEFGADEIGVLLAELVPDLRLADEMVGLLPEVDLGVVAVVPAVGYDAVLGGGGAGEVVGLGGAGDGGEGGLDVG